MKGTGRAINTAAAVFALLGTALHFVPGMRFSSRLAFVIAAVLIFWRILCRWAQKSAVGKRCKSVFSLLCAALMIVLLALEAGVLLHGREDPSAAAPDALIVLGAGVNGERPSLVLQSRIQTAKEYMLRYPDIPVVLSGGQGPGEHITEAEAMRRALWSEDDAWNNRLALEERSTSTAENLAFSKTVLLERGIDPETAVIGVVTNDFHIFRSEIIAHRQDMTVVGCPAEVPWWWLQFNYYLREAFALGKTLLFD